MTETKKAFHEPGVGPGIRPEWLVKALIFLIISLDGRVLADQVSEGKALVMARSKGNCPACHVVGDAELPGNIGPPLVSMRARFPESRLLFEKIWDATESNPDSRMPPFGRHGILSGEEINQIVDYLYTL